MKVYFHYSVNGFSNGYLVGNERTGEAIVIDPGIGFGKGAAGNMELLRRLAELSSFGLPILTGYGLVKWVASGTSSHNGERRGAWRVST